MANLRLVVCSMAVILTMLRSSSILRRLAASTEEEALFGDTYHSQDDHHYHDPPLDSNPPIQQQQQQQDKHSSTRRNSTTTTSRPRIAYMTYSFLETTANFKHMIFPSLDTWLLSSSTEEESQNQNDSTVSYKYFVVLNRQWKQAYQDLCHDDHHNNNNQRYCQRIHPLFVDCPEAKFGESPCCKQQEGLLQMIPIMEQQSYDWLVFQDDDVYLRRDYLQAFLQPLTTTTTTPMIATSGGVRKAGKGRQLGQQGYARIQDRAYNCSDDRQFTYPWGQPVVYNRAALQHIQSGLAQGGLVRQCREFQVTHDSGNAIFHWMYQLPEVRFRVPFFPDMFHEGIMGLHGVAKPNKKKSTMSMAQVHEKLKDLTVPVVDTHKWFQVSGFQQTETYRTYGDPATWNEWHTMPTQDCMGPAAVAKQ